MDTDVCELPKNPIEVPKHTLQDTLTATSNRFQSLDSSCSGTGTPIHQENVLKHHVTRPPAIYIYGIENKYNFIRTVATTCQVQPKIHHGRDFIRLSVENTADLDKLEAYCTQIKIQ